MNHILDITLKDLTQILRDRKTFMFLLIMPIAFTLLFSFAFGGSNTGDDPQDDRLPVGLFNQDNSAFSQELEKILASSQVIRINENPDQTPDELQQSVNDGDLAAALIIPPGYGDSAVGGKATKLIVLVNPEDMATQTIQDEIAAAIERLMNAVHAARVISASNPAVFDMAFQDALAAWENPPVQMHLSQAKSALEENDNDQTNSAVMSASQTSPSMILQFAIAGLLTAAQVLVAERKNRCLLRMLTTSVTRTQILLGHYLSIFVLIVAQFVLLILFGQIFLKVDYLSQPSATLVMTLGAALCIAALGLLIGVIAKNEEQAVAFSLICMFVFAGLGGAWMPLEFTGKTFQAIGHITPVAWAMDGFKNVTVRGLGLESVLLPAAALLGYTTLFFFLSVWRFRYETAK